VVDAGGRLFKHDMILGPSVESNGLGTRGVPITDTPIRSHARLPVEVKLIQTHSARPRILAKGTPPPRPSNHPRESWLLFRLSPMTHTSPGRTM
jgi:hypothetical protein